MTEDVGAAVRLFSWAEKGHLPAPGAVLEQSQSFMDAYEFYLSEKARLRED